MNSKTLNDDLREPDLREPFFKDLFVSLIAF